MQTTYEAALIPFPVLIRLTKASRDQIDRLRHLGTLHPRRIGNYLFFAPTDVDIVREYVEVRGQK